MLLDAVLEPWFVVCKHGRRFFFVFFCGFVEFVFGMRVCVRECMCMCMCVRVLSVFVVCSFMYLKCRATELVKQKLMSIHE